MFSNGDVKFIRSFEQRDFEEGVLVNIDGSGNRATSMSCWAENTLLFIGMEMDR